MVSLGGGRFPYYKKGRGMNIPTYDFASSIKGASGRTHSLLSLCARLILSAIFVYASIDKILHPESFAKHIFSSFSCP
jgi:hypothetical protein